MLAVIVFLGPAHPTKIMHLLKLLIITCTVVFPTASTSFIQTLFNICLLLA